MEIWILSIITITSLAVLLIFGFPISFTMAGLAIFGTLYVWGPAGLYMVAASAFGSGTHFTYIAIPLFLLMAHFLKSSGLAEDLYETMYRWSGHLRGGLAAGTIIICAIFAAMAGISSVATVTMGLIALPSMLKRGYDKSLALGSIMGGGTLGILIPPSIIMIIYGGVAEVSVGQLFMGGVLPGILISLFLILYVLIRCWINPSMGPPVETNFTFKEKLVILKGVILPVLLVMLVLGTIYLGICTPTEAAGIGAFGAFLCVIIYRRLTWDTLKSAILDVTKTNAMIMWIIIGAACFAKFVAVSGLQDSIFELMVNLDISRWWIIIFMQMAFFILGMFLDPAGIVTLLGPLFVPIVINLGFDPLWFGILFVVNMEIGYLTPPFGFNLFYMKGVAPPEITMKDIYRAITPFIAILLLGLIVLMIFPQIALWLPSMMTEGGAS
ncbi:TRAP transporter large permease [Desulfatitalea tepidiphila]|uniref:TRAP transporter large permease n=1 Tax=Desulfatitalea tepidiphila TaxID=1185843 RepID=UPI0006B47455|nr:TRAP transporter large permease subunit [Desulfatitalea tepidiphila]